MSIGCGSSTAAPAFPPEDRLQHLRTLRAALGPATEGRRCASPRQRHRSRAREAHRREPWWPRLGRERGDAPVSGSDVRVHRFRSGAAGRSRGRAASSAELYHSMSSEGENAPSPRPLGPNVSEGRSPAAVVRKREWARAESRSRIDGLNPARYRRALGDERPMRLRAAKSLSQMTRMNRGESDRDRRSGFLAWRSGTRKRRSCSWRRLPDSVSEDVLKEALRSDRRHSRQREPSEGSRDRASARLRLRDALHAGRSAGRARCAQTARCRAGKSILRFAHSRPSRRAKAESAWSPAARRRSRGAAAVRCGAAWNGRRWAASDGRSRTGSAGSDAVRREPPVRLLAAGHRDAHQRRRRRRAGRARASPDGRGRPQARLRLRDDGERGRPPRPPSRQLKQADMRGRRLIINLAHPKGERPAPRDGGGFAAEAAAGFAVAVAASAVAVRRGGGGGLWAPSGGGGSAAATSDRTRVPASRKTFDSDRRRQGRRARRQQRGRPGGNKRLLRRGTADFD